MKTFTAVLTNSPAERVWEAHVAEEPRIHTYGRSISAALDHLRDATALWYEIDADDVELLPDPQIPAVYRKAVRSASDQRQKLSEAEVLANKATRTAVVGLAKYGLSRRDIGALLGISHQRVQQLID